jgi:F-type H+-transporting ATPase subunit epsilon
METVFTLKILLPYKPFAVVMDVLRLSIETSAGSYGFLPNRLDCVAEIVPGILSYESQQSGVLTYVAVDRGILIKTGPMVSISVRNAFGGADLGKLHDLVDKEFKQLGEEELTVHHAVLKLESSFIRTLEKFRST